MNPTQKAMSAILDWCASIVGPCTTVQSDARFHGRTTVIKLESSIGTCFLKMHRDRSTWDAEVQGYEQWAPALKAHAPRLLGVHEKGPLALLIAELPGRRMEDVELSEAKLQRAWHAAGSALARLHDCAIGRGFGPCRRQGSFVETEVTDPADYVSGTLHRDAQAAQRAGYLSDSEMHLVRTALDAVGVFEGEPPIPCHRDYNPANWLIDEDDRWMGVIDFEMSAWDVRVADFSRYPRWEWMVHPERIDAFFDGYGRAPSANECDQLRIAHMQYALGCILWGHEHNYMGLVREAHDALAALGQQT